MITFCPHCGQKYDLPREYAGQQAECEVCQKMWVIPTDAGHESQKTSQTVTMPVTEKSVGRKVLATCAALIIAFIAHAFTMEAICDVLQRPVKAAIEEVKQRKDEFEGIYGVYAGTRLNRLQQKRVDNALKRWEQSRVRSGEVKKNCDAAIIQIGTVSFCSFMSLGIIAIIGICRKKYTPGKCKHDLRAAGIFAGFAFLTISAGIGGELLRAGVALITGGVAVILTLCFFFTPAR